MRVLTNPKQPPLHSASKLQNLRQGQHIQNQDALKQCHCASKPAVCLIFPMIPNRKTLELVLKYSCCSVGALTQFFSFCSLRCTCLEFLVIMKLKRRLRLPALLCYKRSRTCWTRPFVLGIPSRILATQLYEAHTFPAWALTEWSEEIDAHHTHTHTYTKLHIALDHLVFYIWVVNHDPTLLKFLELR